MYTLDTKSIKKTIKVYAIISLISIIFSYVYEQFSYGVYSYFMRLLFIVPLVGGVIIYGVVYLKKIKVTRISYSLWNSGIAILMSGMLIRGIINISGRYTEYDTIYWELGTIFVLLAIIMQASK